MPVLEGAIGVSGQQCVPYQVTGGVVGQSSHWGGIFSPQDVLGGALARGEHFDCATVESHCQEGAIAKELQALH